MDTEPPNEPSRSPADLPDHGRASSPRGKRTVWVAAGVLLIIGVGIAIYLATRSSELLESSFAGVVGEGSSKTAIVRLWNVSDREVSFRTSHLFYRFRGTEWNVPPGPPLADIKYPRYVRPGTAVDFPILLRTKDGNPISGPVEVGISYATTKTTWIASVPASIRNSIGTAVGVTEGRSVKGVHWIKLVAP